MSSERTTADIVAWLALGVAFVSLGWNVYTWWGERRTRVIVDISRVRELSSQEENVVVSLHVINLSNHIIRPIHFGLELADGSKRYLKSVIYPQIHYLLVEIPPRDGTMTLLGDKDVRSLRLDLSSPIRVWVELSTRETFWSKGVTLATDSAKV